MTEAAKKAADLEAQAATLEAEAAAIDKASLPDHCTFDCNACNHKGPCDQVTQLLGKAYILRQRAANLLKG